MIAIPVVVTIVLLLAVPAAFARWAGERGDRALPALAGLWVAVCLSGAAWVVFVIAHFVSKYW